MASIIALAGGALVANVISVVILVNPTFSVSDKTMKKPKITFSKFTGDPQ
jgi:hypothetical protein